MKYIVFWEFRPEDLDKVIELSMKEQKEIEKNPEKFGKYIMTPQSIGGQMKGFSVVEATPEQMVLSVLHWGPEVKMKYMPIVDAAKFIAQYMKSK